MSPGGNYGMKPAVTTTGKLLQTGCPMLRITGLRIWLAEPGFQRQDAVREGGGPVGDVWQDPGELRGHAGLAVLAVRRAELVEVPVLPVRVQVRADGIEFGLDPPAGHHAQQVAELRPEPGFDGVPVGGSDDEHGLVLAGPEGGHRDCGAGVSQVAEVVVQVMDAASPGATSPVQVRPASSRGRAWRRVPARITMRVFSAVVWRIARN